MSKWVDINDVAIDAKTLEGIPLSQFIYGNGRGTINFSGSADQIIKSGFYRLNNDGRINMLAHCQHPTDGFAFQIGRLYYGNNLLYREQIDGKWSDFKIILDNSLISNYLSIGGGILEQTT